MIGASFDPPGDNNAFAVDQELPFALVSDTDGSVAEAYGAKRPTGSRWAAVPERRTYLIDPDGVLRLVYDVTDVHGHAAEVLGDLRALQEGGPA